MDFVKAIFNNAWTIGIFGSTISGLIVFFATEYFAKKKINKRLKETIDLANSEIMYAFRPFIAKKTALDRHLVNALLSAIAKKYELPIDSIISRQDLDNQMVKEIIDNPFLTPEDKLEYCRLIMPKENNHQVKNQQNTEYLVHQSKLLSALEDNEYKKLKTGRLSLLASLLTSITVFITTVTIPSELKDFLTSDKVLTIVGMMGLALGLILVGLQLREKQLPATPSIHSTEGQEDLRDK